LPRLYQDKQNNAKHRQPGFTGARLGALHEGHALGVIHFTIQHQPTGKDARENILKIVKQATNPATMRLARHLQH